MAFTFKTITAKLDKKCRYLNSFDHQNELAFKNFSIIFENIYTNLLVTKKNSTQNN